MLKPVALAFVLLALTGAVAQGQQPTRDSVRGSAIQYHAGSQGASGAYITIDAESNSNGTNPSGEIGILVNCELNGPACSSNFNAAGGRVTCLNVKGNRAIIGYYGSRRGISDSPDVRVRGLVEVIDNGQGTVTSPTDSLSNRTRYIDFFFPTTPDVPITSCPDRLPSEHGDWVEFESGPISPVLQPTILKPLQDFTVIDARPTRRFEPACTEQRGTIRFVNPQCKRTIP